MSVRAKVIPLSRRELEEQLNAIMARVVQGLAEESEERLDARPRLISARELVIRVRPFLVYN